MFSFRKMNSGTKNPIIALDLGYLRRRSKMMDIQNHGRHLYTDARRITNPEASHRRLLNVECTLLLDISLAAIPLNHFTTRWLKLPCFNHHYRALLPTTWMFQSRERAVQKISTFLVAACLISTSNVLYRTSYVQLTSIPLPSERSVAGLKLTLAWI